MTNEINRTIKASNILAVIGAALLLLSLLVACASPAAQPSPSTPTASPVPGEGAR